MNRFLSGITKWLAQKATTLLLILAVLIGGDWISGELKAVAEYKNELDGLVAKKNEIFQQTESLTRNISTRLSTLNSAQLERDSLWYRHPIARKNPLSEISIKIKLLDLQISGYKEVVNMATEAKASTLGAMHELNTRISSIDEKLNKNFFQKTETLIYQKLPVGLWILLGIILVPIAIKVFFYFIIAPWAAGRPPIRLLPSASGSILLLEVDGVATRDRGKISAVSRAIVLGENQELLIQPEYLQSTSLQARKETKWLLNSSIPFSSLLSGMFMLTRVSPAGSEPVVISATKDPLSEVGIIDLAEGTAFVCQPRSLAGVIQDRSNPIRITRHWRLRSLQSWLTLQLRFLVFHGPGQLVMKGCRGIRIESAGMGRLINQSATLGFSANLDYANTRCETFVSYWTGKEELFNDLFKGESGVYIYEEMPDLKRAAGITGRGLEGFADATLKVFGV